MSVVLGYQGEDGYGWWSVPLKAINIAKNVSSPDASNVATGTVVQFGLRTYEMSKEDSIFIRYLKDMRKQKPN